jgi:hypothetical protein
MPNERNEFVRLVAELHSYVGYSAATVPNIGSEDRRRLWLSLFREEVGELESAILHEDIVQVSDAIGDCLYVLFGASLAFGLPIEDIYREIHRANMSKDRIVGSDGPGVGEEIKLRKGTRYVAPALQEILKVAHSPRGV